MTTTETKRSSQSRPYRVTMTGGRCLATFKYYEHAVERARTLLESGQLHMCWVRDRDSQEFRVFRRPRRRGTLAG